MTDDGPLEDDGFVTVELRKAGGELVNKRLDLYKTNDELFLMEREYADNPAGQAEAKAKYLRKVFGLADDYEVSHRLVARFCDRVYGTLAEFKKKDDSRRTGSSPASTAPPP